MDSTKIKAQDQSHVISAFVWYFLKKKHSFATRLFDWYNRCVYYKGQCIHSKVYIIYKQIHIKNIV